MELNYDLIESFISKNPISNEEAPNLSNKEKKCSTVSKSELELGNQNIKALYDTSKKSMSDFVAEYQRVSNNDYYGKTRLKFHSASHKYLSETR